MYSSNWPLVFFCERCRGRSHFPLCPSPGRRRALLQPDGERTDNTAGENHAARAVTEGGPRTHDGN